MSKVMFPSKSGADWLNLERDGVTVGAGDVFGDVVDVIDWTDVRHVVQVAGGSGAFLAAILHRLPAATGVLFDAPEVVAEAGPTLYAAGVTDRVDCAGGDLFREIPPGGDLYFISQAFRGWTDERVVRLLRQCHDVMGVMARLVLAESAAPPARTSESWHALLAAGGFRLASARDAACGWSVLEATPAA